MHSVGNCHFNRGDLPEGLPWFERAVAAKEKGDVDGRVDAASLGTSMHWVGTCHFNLGDFTEALPWFERAVAAKEKGDVNGRVDSESRG